MDWIIEKAIELGAAGIVPLAAQRCVVRLSAERAEKKLAHWQAIIVSASEQSGRNRLAQLAPLQEFHQWSRQQDLHQRIILTPRAEQSLADWARHQPPQALSVMVGPEGGLYRGRRNSGHRRRRHRFVDGAAHLAHGNGGLDGAGHPERAVGRHVGARRRPKATTPRKLVSLRGVVVSGCRRQTPAAFLHQCDDQNLWLYWADRRTLRGVE